MMRRRRVILFFLSALLSFMPVYQALADNVEMTYAAQFEECVFQLDDYLANPNSADSFDIASICDSLSVVHGYGGRKGVAFLAYAMVIRDVELGQWNDVEENLSIIEANKDFEEYVNSEEFNKSHNQIRRGDILRKYCDGRKAETEGQWQRAIDCYKVTTDENFYDSFARLRNVRRNIERQMEDRYNHALALYQEQGALLDAAAEFQRLASYKYKDSEALYNEITAKIGKNEEEKREEIYQTGLEQLSNGDYKAASATFSSLGDYKDSAGKIEEVNELLRKETIYQTGRAQLDNGDYTAALSTFSGLRGYKDSGNMEQLCMQKIADEQNRQSIEEPKNWLIGHWVMTERRKNKYNDVITFDVYIHKIHDNGKVEVTWGADEIEGKLETVRLEAENRNYYILTVHTNQVYVLAHRVLSGGNEFYSGLAVKEGTINLPRADSIIGHWTMIERRKNEYNDIIIFPVDITRIDGGEVTMIWGASGEIKGKLDVFDNCCILTTHGDQVYVFQYGMIAGGSGKYSGVAIQ